jgi:hypothetical protein
VTSSMKVSGRLVTILDGRPATRPTGLAYWLERVRARKSHLVYASDRDTAVAFALRWHLDLARIRITPGGRPTTEQIRRDLITAGRGRRSWHSA